MSYLIRLLSASVAGTGSVVAVHEVQDPTFAMIVIVVVVAAFVVACVWRFSEVGHR